MQCAPDHPWAEAHPDWFTVLPDGTIAYAENPPKKYQDIYPLNFDNDPKGLYEEVLRVVRFWVKRGVKVFRVDNPHTKPGNFWEWLIDTVHQSNPEVIFLAEAFTAPARLYGLAKAGFTQSYIYFPWKTTKKELTEFGEEIVRHTDIARPSLWVNTPDILHEFLVKGGRGAFAIRAALASTMSPLWGMYSGYELYENVPVKEGSEEYLDSEKYQLRHRDYDAALESGDSLEPFITLLNTIRREHPALQQLRTLRFHDIGNDNLLAYSKIDRRRRARRGQPRSVERPGGHPRHRHELHRPPQHRSHGRPGPDHRPALQLGQGELRSPRAVGQRRPHHPASGRARGHPPQAGLARRPGLRGLTPHRPHPGSIRYGTRFPRIRWRRVPGCPADATAPPPPHQIDPISDAQPGIHLEGPP